MNTKVFDQVLVLALMLSIGVLLRKRQLITDPVRKGLVELLMNVTMPLLIVSSFNFRFSAELLRNAGVVFGASFAIHLSLALLSRLIYCRFEAGKRRMLSFSTVFSNCGFVGYPVVQGLFGGVGVFYTSIFTIPVNLFMWTYGVMLFTGRRDWRGLLRNFWNPPLIATVFGMLIFFFSLQLPAPVLRTCESVGAMTTPLSMFIIGAMLADVELRDVLASLDVYYLSIVKLLVAPILCLLLLRLWGADPLLTGVCVVLVAMPTATLVGVLAEKYDGDRSLASRCAFLTTVFSLLSIPAVMHGI